jgi:hypothetical protein
LSGEIAVGRAREADHADEATHAVNADNALRADRATEADHASKATNADYSTNANRASEADHSDTATNATHADRATNADNADRADFAGHATSANNATRATTADVATHLEGVLPIESGGSGANTVEGAWENLGLNVLGKIEQGSYVGTGAFGENNPNSLTFGFVPKFVIIEAPSMGVTYMMLNGVSVNSVLSRESGTGYVTWHTNRAEWNGNTVTWYSHGNSLNSAGGQMNANGNTYRYVAIG